MHTSARIAGLALLVAAAGTACNSDTDATLPPTVRVTPQAPWAGSVLRLTSPAFVHGGDQAVLQVGTSVLPVSRLDDTTLTARLPDSVSGAFTPRLLLDGEPVLLDPLTIYGYAGTFEMAPSLEWDIAVWPRNGHASIIGTSQGGLTLIELDTRTSRSYAGLGNVSGMRGAGMTYTDNGLLLYPDDSTSLELWSLSGVPTFLRSFPDLKSEPRQSMQLGPDAWFFSSHHEIWTSVRTDSTQPYQTVRLTAEETEGVHMSPRHDRATIQVDYSASGIPVFDSPSGQLAYFLPQLKTSEGADFSPDGELLAVVGGDRGVLTPGRILLVRAETGTVLRDTVIAEPVFAVAFDPVRPLLYVGLSAADSAQGPEHPAVLVLDLTTFDVLGRLAPPRSTPDCWGGCYKGVIAISAEPALYTAWSFDSAKTLVSRYTLPQ